MSDICLRGSAPRSAPASHGHPTSRRARDWWPHLRDRLLPDRGVADDAFSDRLLNDIGLSRADLAALKL